MKEKAMLFPCDRELASFMDCVDPVNYEIKGLCVLEDSNVDDLCDIPVFDIGSIDFNLFDVLILVDNAFYSHSFIKDCIERGKKIVNVEEIEKIDVENIHAILEKQSVSVPIIFVMGITPYTEKFHVQIALRKAFANNGYKVSQIGSKSYSGLFGFHSYPSFMNEPMDNTERIMLFRKYVKYIEQQEQPDLIVIGVPGGIMAVNKKHYFDFGMTAYMVSQAIEPDYVIMSMLYSKSYTIEQLEEINQTCKYKFNFEIQSFHLSNTLLDPTSLKSERLTFIKIGNKKYTEKVDRLYDFLNQEDMNKAFDAMITKLSSYNVNQFF